MQPAVNSQATQIEIKDLYELHSWRNAGFIVLEWLSILLVVYCTQRFFNPLTYFMAVVWIGSRMHALAILMHEAAHYRLFSSRKLSEFIGEVFLAWPITLTLKGYRCMHLTHHQHLNTDEDPDWAITRADYGFPKTKKQMMLVLLETALGIGFYREFTETTSSKEFNEIPRSLRIAQLGFYVAVVACSIAFSFWKLLILYWAVPLMTSLILFAYVRAIAEHYALDYSHELRNSRNTIASFWEGILLAPYNVGFHLDHHLHPGVPWYNLGALHAILMRDPDYKSNAHITKEGYVQGVLQECTRSGPK